MKVLSSLMSVTSLLLAMSGAVAWAEPVPPYAPAGSQDGNYGQSTPYGAVPQYGSEGGYNPPAYDSQYGSTPRGETAPYGSSPTYVTPPPPYNGGSEGQYQSQGGQGGVYPPPSRGYGDNYAPSASRGYGDNYAPSASRGYGENYAPPTGRGYGENNAPPASYRGEGNRSYSGSYPPAVPRTYGEGGYGSAGQVPAVPAQSPPTWRESAPQSYPPGQGQAGGQGYGSQPIPYTVPSGSGGGAVIYGGQPQPQRSYGQGNYGQPTPPAGSSFSPSAGQGDSHPDAGFVAKEPPAKPDQWRSKEPTTEGDRPGSGSVLSPWGSGAVEGAGKPFPAPTPATPATPATLSAPTTPTTPALVLPSGGDSKKPSGGGNSPPATPGQISSPAQPAAGSAEQR